MRILILGNNYSAQRFFELFSKNSENIVFSLLKNDENRLEFTSNDDIYEFCAANVINFVLVTDEEFIINGLAQKLEELDLSVFAPSSDASEICTSKSFAKKFMHKNKIPTPKFYIAEKPQQANDYLKQSGFAQTIKPDKTSYIECPKFVETKTQARQVISNLFNNGNQKVVIEDYIEGKNISVWVITDGYSAKIIGTSAKYQNNIAIFEPDFVVQDIKNEIFEKIVMPTISALSSTEAEYIGILGFDIMLSSDGKFNLISYNSFFDDINVDFFTNLDVDWLDVFESTIRGDVFLKYQFEFNPDFMLTLRQNEEIEIFSAKTKNVLEKCLIELDYDLGEYYEAKKVWKF